MTAPLRFEPDHEVIARLQTENYDLRDSYQNWLDASAEIDRLTAELSAARAEIAQLRGGWVKCSDRLPPVDSTISINVIGRDDKGNVWPDIWCDLSEREWFSCDRANIIEWRLMEATND